MGEFCHLAWEGDAVGCPRPIDPLHICPQHSRSIMTATRTGATAAATGPGATPVGGVEEVAVREPAGDAQADDLEHAAEQGQLVHGVLRSTGVGSAGSLQERGAGATGHDSVWPQCRSGSAGPTVQAAGAATAGTAPSGHCSRWLGPTGVGTSENTATGYTSARNGRRDWSGTTRSVASLQGSAELRGESAPGRWRRRRWR